jgi:hypothetical protein
MSTEDYLSDEEDIQSKETNSSEGEKTSTVDSAALNTPKDPEEFDKSGSTKDDEEIEAIKFLEVLVPKESLVRKRAFSALLRQIVER